MAEEQWIPENKAELMSAIRREWKLLDGCGCKARGAENDHAR